MNYFTTIAIFFACSVYAQDIYFPPNNGDIWETNAPERLGWNADSLTSLHDYLEEKNTKSFIILKEGKIVVEWYFGDFTENKVWYWASAGKSLTAFLIGQAQEEGLLDIHDKTLKYLGQGWTTAPEDKEDKITIRHQLTMTSGLDDDIEINTCTLDSCLHYYSDAGDRWAYHNAAYTLLLDVIEEASGLSKNRFTQTHLLNRIGMNGLWIKVGYNQIYYSNTRSMARFGLLVQNLGIWKSDTLLHDLDYIEAMTSSSQSINKSYGYLWWLNGKGGYMLPQSQFLFDTDLIPNAPNDVIAALGKDDQKIYISDSLGLTIIRMGQSAGHDNFALSSFDNELWGKIMRLESNITTIDYSAEILNNSSSHNFRLSQNTPNPFNDETVIQFTLPNAGRARVQVYSLQGKRVETLADAQFPAGKTSLKFQALNLPSGIYFLILSTNNITRFRKMTLLR